MEAFHCQARIGVGWIVNLRARVLAAFTTSMEVGVTVTAENPLDGMRKLATSALLTFVALSSSGERVKVPPLLLETEEDRIAFQQAQVRRGPMLKQKKQGPLSPLLIPTDQAPADHQRQAPT